MKVQMLFDQVCLGVFIGWRTWSIELVGKDQIGG